MFLTSISQLLNEDNNGYLIGLSREICSSAGEILSSVLGAM